MSTDKLEQLRFPIGRYNPGGDIGPDDVLAWVEDIRLLPSQLSQLVEAVTDHDLTKQYRPGSWTVRQVVHHIADSHCNAYSRMKRTLTEDVPTIFPYDEGAWAQLPDVGAVSLQVSLQLIQAIHERLHHAIWDLSLSQLGRQYQHTSMDGPQSMAYLIGMYAWHGKHHLGHLSIALDQ